MLKSHMHLIESYHKLFSYKINETRIGKTLYFLMLKVLTFTKTLWTSRVVRVDNLPLESYDITSQQIASVIAVPLSVCDGI